MALGTVLVAIVVRMIGKQFKLRLPELLIAIAAAGLATWWFDLGSAKWGVKLVDKIPRTLPWFQVPAWDWALVRELAPSALAVALCWDCLEAIAMAKSIAIKTRQKLDINQQCLSEGLANLARQFLSLLSWFRFANAILYQLSSWSCYGMVRASFAAAAVALTVLLFAPLAQYIPRSGAGLAY